MNEQIISLATVEDLTDSTRNGSFLARIDALGDKEKTVNYVSPYASNEEGAFVAIPEVGTQILVCKPGNTSEWYYLGATFAPEPKQVDGSEIPDGDTRPLERALPNLYRSRGVPMQVAMKTPNGAGMLVSEEYTEGYVNRKTELTSTVNKKITLNDSPGIDAIILDSGNGSKITLSNDPDNQSTVARSIQVESVGPQKYINTESQTDIVVGAGGRELQLVNTASGVEWGPGIPCGNVNVQSKKRDVNVFTQGEQGRIFIECLNEGGSNQYIQIETNGAGGAIVIKTKGDIRLDAGGNIDMKAGGKITMQSGDNYSIKSGGSLEVQSSANANIDAPTINLANGASPATPNVQGQQSVYNNRGVTTY
jgi:hypothetical protein